jgi:hypothetical protein
MFVIDSRLVRFPFERRRRGSLSCTTRGFSFLLVRITVLPSDGIGLIELWTVFSLFDAHDVGFD